MSTNMSLISLSVVLFADTPKGTLVDANGRLVTSVNVPVFGVTEVDGKKDERVLVTCSGVAQVLANNTINKSNHFYAANGKAQNTTNYTYPLVGIALEGANAGELFTALLK